MYFNFRIMQFWTAATQDSPVDIQGRTFNDSYPTIPLQEQATCFQPVYIWKLIECKIYALRRINIKKDKRMKMTFLNAYFKWVLLAYCI